MEGPAILLGTGRGIFTLQTCPGELKTFFTSTPMVKLREMRSTSVLIAVHDFLPRVKCIHPMAWTIVETAKEANECATSCQGLVSELAYVFASRI